MKLLISLLLLIASFADSIGQNLLSFQDTSGAPIANGSLIVMNGTLNDWEIRAELFCSLNGSGLKTVALKRFELSMLSGTANYMCSPWGCGIPINAGAQPLYMDQWDYTMTPGVFVGGVNLSHLPQGQVGCMAYRYVWYDINDLTDSSWVDIEFCTVAVGIGEQVGEANIFSFDMYPNPVQSGLVRVEFSDQTVTFPDAVLVQNALGGEVLRIPVESSATSFVVSVEGLRQGVYFCSLLSNGELLSTRRLSIID